MADNITIELRELEMSDYQSLKSSMIEAYPDSPSDYWEEEHIRKLLEIFPEGQIGISVNGTIVGCALSIIVHYEHFGDEHTYQQITGNYTFNTHSPKGDVLYGIEVFVHPDYRGLRLGRRLYDARKELCENLNLRAIIFGGRIPNYHLHAHTVTPKEYIQKVKHKEIYDPTLTFQLSNDFHIKKVLKGYLPGDKSSQEYATLLQWDNIYYSRKTGRLSDYEPIVRLGLVQWQMRSYQSIDELFEQVEYFVDAVSGYQSDFALFPEFYNAPLMAAYNHLAESEAIRQLATFTEESRNRFLNLAISYNINIITGSMPLLRDDKLYSVGYLCRRNGTFEEYEKIHVTPDEVKSWGMVGGRKVKVFETDCGPIGILMSYDIVFPELSRLLGQQGIKILFVPFVTDTQNAYELVRTCARARAIESECYVAIAGAVGNLPRVHNMDIQFAQSAVFTPCDFSFPTNGIRAEATPNTEMILVSDLDLDLLTELHTYGGVRSLKDRRTDIYEVMWKKGRGGEGVRG